jgi:hypothetical protein
MLLQKPTVIVTGPALVAIQGNKHIDFPLDNLQPQIFETTTGAYESDE